MTESKAKNNINCKFRIIVVLLSILAFILSLTQDAIIYEDYDGQKTDSSISLLIMGGIAILGGGLFEWLTWMANPIYLLSTILFLTHKRIAFALSLIATLIGLSFYNWTKILVAENGRTATITSFELGYWFWVLSLSILTVGTLVYFLRDKSKKAQHPVMTSLC